MLICVQNNASGGCARFAVVVRDGLAAWFEGKDSAQFRILRGQIQLTGSGSRAGTVVDAVTVQ